MESSNTKVKLVAIATGTVLLIGSIGVLLYWQINRRAWCVRTVSISSQEVTYSWGCVHPQRFRQWSITASAQPGERTGFQNLKTNRFQSIHGDVEGVVKRQNIIEAG
jgi:hypothetical protein